jgi:hypothetical protein
MNFWLQKEPTTKNDAVVEAEFGAKQQFDNSCMHVIYFLKKVVYGYLR